MTAYFYFDPNVDRWHNGLVGVADGTLTLLQTSRMARSESNIYFDLTQTEVRRHA